MIKVNVSYQNLEVSQITVKGHAFYDTLGKDIVCASVSSMVTITINNILALDSEAITYQNGDGFITIKINNNNKIALKLIEVLIMMLKELAQEYPKNIKIGGLKWNF